MKRNMDPDRHFTPPAGGERALCQAGRSGWRPIRLEIDAPGDYNQIFDGLAAGGESPPAGVTSKP
ncbi:MAG: hypothetical protein ACOYLF_13650 [Blastocatellia bacterium]